MQAEWVIGDWAADVVFNPDGRPALAANKCFNGCGSRTIDETEIGDDGEPFLSQLVTAFESILGDQGE